MNHQNEKGTLTLPFTRKERDIDSINQQAKTDGSNCVPSPYCSLEKNVDRVRRLNEKGR